MLTDGLTREQIQRQEFVDNEIVSMLNTLTTSQVRIEYEPRMIFEIREVIMDWLVNKLELEDEMSFYPYVEEE